MTYQSRVSQIQTTSRWRLVGLPILIGVVVLFVIPTSFTAVFSTFLPGKLEDPISVSSAAGMWVALIGGGMLMIYVSKLSWQRLGFNKQGWLTQAVTGLAAGALALALVSGLTALTGAVKLSWAFTGSALAPIIVAAFFFLAQGTWEELIYRGYLMPLFSKAWGDRWSIIITSLMFAAGHALNPGMTFMPILNLVIYGFVFALLYYRSGSLWVTGLAHSAWNFCQGFIFGSEVSGNAAAASVLRTVPVPGSDLLSGGPFGYEGSLITSLFGLLLIALMIWAWPSSKESGVAQ